MMMPRLAILLVCWLVCAGCARDPLEETAWQASRTGTAAGRGRAGADTVGLEAGARIVERFYYVAKRQASREQRTRTETEGRRIAQERPAARRTPRKSGRYLAVRTASDSRSTTGTNVMLWDTVLQEIVGNHVYDLNAPPPAGALVRFDTYTAEYVGAGG